MTRYFFVLVMLASWHSICALSFANEDPSFDDEVAPILVRRCTGCHNGFDRKGGLDLVSRAAAMKGGDSGAVLAPGKTDESPLWERIESGEMPPEGPPLPEAEKLILKKWIEGGARWSSDRIDVFRFTTDSRAGRDWWSMQPVKRPTVPASWTGHPIDYFVRTRLRPSKLESSPRADRRTLIRRAYFNLCGLPPSVEDVEAFASDDSDDAYERLIERLLTSKHYGERWARHWLDVARYGESDGFEYDRMRPNAWHYRDWVINAINDDLPYDQFAKLQLAGDVLRPNDRDAIIATGFLVCGAHDGLVPQGNVMRKIMRQDTLEDFVGTVCQTFLGLTVNCARCHDHKFDPISQVEYYQLASALSGVNHGERSLPAQAEIESELSKRIESIQAKVESIDAPVRAAILKKRAAEPTIKSDAPAPIIEFDLTDHDSAGIKAGTLHGKASLRDDGLEVSGNGSYFASAPLKKKLREKTLTASVRLKDLGQRGGAAISVQTLDGTHFDAIVFGEREPKRWMAGSNGFTRTESFGGVEEKTAQSEFVHFAITYGADGTIAAYRNGEPYGKSYKSSGPHRFESGEFQVLLGLRHGPAEKSRMLSGRIQRARVYDYALDRDEIAASMSESSNYVSETSILAALGENDREQRKSLVDELQSKQKELAGYRSGKAYAVVAKKAPVAHLLSRGNPLSPAEEVKPAGIASLQLDADFGLSKDATDADRRQRLADWITQPQNPLFARVIVNRVWMYHFGQGLVLTPNDFGFNGGKPSHPDLLDWLASEFTNHGYSLKKLHQIVMTSETYRQSSRNRKDAMAVDANNRLMWKFSARRMDAEEIRDSILAVSGKLKRQIGGSPFQDVRPYTHRGAQFYDSIDPVGDQFNRRSIYRMWARGGRNPLLDAFDCPDPSSTAPQRASTTTPLQALAMMNQSFVLRMSDAFAERIDTKTRNDKSQDVATASLQNAFQFAFQRTATVDELSTAKHLVKDFGIKALCRVLLNSNEFLTIE